MAKLRLYKLLLAISCRDYRATHSAIRKSHKFKRLTTKNHGALQLAVRTNNKDILKLLLQTFNTPNEHVLGITALHEAAAFSEELVQILIANSADLNVRDFMGLTPLHWAIMYSFNSTNFINSSNSGRVELNYNIIRVLLENGADPNIQDIHGQTPLHLACYYNFKRIMTLLFRHGGSFNIADNSGHLPLQYAKLTRI